MPADELVSAVIDSEIKKALVLLTHPNQITPEIAAEWLRKSRSYLRQFGRLLHASGATVQQQQCYLAKITLTKSLNQQFKCFCKVGAAIGGRHRERRSDRVVWEDVKSAFKCRLRTGVVINIKHVDTRYFLEDCFILFQARIKNMLKRVDAVRVHIVLAAKFSVNRNDEEVIDIKSFNTKSVPIHQTTNLLTWFKDNVIQIILRDMGEFQERDSGWTLHSLINLTININQYNPLRGSTWCDLPTVIKQKRACINVENTDNECFRWAVLSGLHPTAKHANRVSKYQPYKEELNFAGKFLCHV